jgi:hypothetical protein
LVRSADLFSGTIWEHFLLPLKASEVSGIFPLLGLENWALFEFKAIINPLIPVQRVSKNDPSLKQALEILHFSVAE